MKALRLGFLFVRHLVLVTLGGQLRFRLETFGVYFPALPYKAPFWRVSPRVAGLLVTRLLPYARWVAEMEDIRRGGGKLAPSAPWMELEQSDRDG